MTEELTDRKALAREIAARTTPRFMEIKRERKKRGFPLGLSPQPWRLIRG